MPPAVTYLSRTEVLRRLGHTLFISHLSPLEYTHHPPTVSPLDQEALPATWAQVLEQVRPTATHAELLKASGLSKQELHFITAHLLTLGVLHQPRQGLYWRSSAAPALSGSFSFHDLKKATHLSSNALKQQVLRDLRTRQLFVVSADPVRYSTQPPSHAPALPERWQTILQAAQQLGPPLTTARLGQRLHTAAPQLSPPSQGELRWIIKHLQAMQRL